MNEINTAIYGKLAGDATLTALVSSFQNATSIFHLQAPEGADFNYIVFNKQAETEPNDSRHRIIDLVYQVRAFAKDGSLPGAKAAQAIDARGQVLLHGATLTISNHTLLKINRIGGLEDATAEPNTDVVYSAGSLYRVRVERTS
jgi:uncharacterized protein DUF3168